MSALAGSVLALALVGLATTYLVYPLCVVAWGSLRGRARGGAAATRTAVPDAELPRVSFIISAYNEEDSIAGKLHNTLSLDYPSDRLEVIVASDGSDDATDRIVSEHPDSRVRLVRNPDRGGKTATTALAVAAARGSILVFSDATGEYNAEALRALVAPFAAPDVGAVSGRVVYRYGESATSRGFRLYQRWVVEQRRAEPHLHTLTSVSGSIHALRREIFEPVPSELSYDMIVPALVAMHGKRCVYADAATSLESSRLAVREEFGARVRIALRAYAYLGWLWTERSRLIDPAFGVQLFLHKVLRWFSVHMLLAALAAHGLLALSAGGAAALLLLPHVGLYALAAASAWDEERVRFPGSAALLLFATANAAHAVGFWRWLWGQRAAAWTPDRSAERAASQREADGPSTERSPEGPNASDRRR